MHVNIALAPGSKGETGSIVWRQSRTMKLHKLDQVSAFVVAGAFDWNMTIKLILKSVAASNCCTWVSLGCSTWMNYMNIQMNIDQMVLFTQ